MHAILRANYNLLIVCSFAVCLSTLITTPIALMNTSKLVEPALINGSGSPVGGIEPETTAMFKITCMAIIAPMPKHKKAENLLFAFMPTLKMQIISARNNATTIKQPTKPSSSAIMEKMKSLSLKGRKSSA